MPHRVIKTINGRRGAGLTIAGGMFTLLSVSQILRPDPSWMPGWLSYSALGWAFLACSAFALTVGLFSKRLPTGALAHGYAAAFIPPLGLAALYTLAALLGASPTAYIYAAIFVGFASFIYLVSGWEEPPPHQPMTDEQRQIVEGDA